MQPLSTLSRPAGASLLDVLARTYKRDRDGRFGSGGGGVRDSLAQAKTTADVAAAASRELSALGGRHVEVDLKGMEVSLAREHMEGLIRGAERNPTAALMAVTTYGPGGVIRRHPADPTGTVAFAISSSYGEVSFNVHDAPGAYRGKLDLARAAGYGVAEGPMGVAFHEYGHIISQNGDGPVKGYIAAIASSSRAGQSVEKHVTDQLSVYATSSEHELAGEAYASVMTHGAAAPRLAHEVVAELDATYTADRQSGNGRNLTFLEILARTYKRDRRGRFGTGDGGGEAKAADAQIAALPRIEDPSDRRAQAKATNPGYLGPYTGPPREGGASYAQNCSRVAIAYEMRRRGIDVTAGAGSPEGDTIAAYVHTFREDGKYSTRLAEDLSRNMSVREVAAEVEGWPHGARGIVTIQGHTLSVERDAKTGKAVFVDAQAAKKQSPVLTRAQLETRMKTRGAPTDKWAAVARVDDLGLSDYSLRYVESPGLSIADGKVGKTAFPTDPDSPTFSSYEQMAGLPPDDSYP